MPTEGRVTPAARTRGIAGFAQVWARAILGTSFPDSGLVGIERRLHALSQRLIDVLLREPFVADEAGAVAAALLEHTYGASDALAATMEVCGSQLLTALALESSPELTGRVAALQGAFARGYAGALRERILADQDLIHRAARRSTTDRLRLIFSAPTVGIVVADDLGRIRDTNDAFARMVGVAPGRMLGRSLCDFAHPDDAARLREELAAQRRDGTRRIRGDLRLTSPSGAVVHADLSTSCHHSGSRCEAQLSLITDVTDRHQLQERLRYQARHDPLTGLPNRVMLRERVEQLTAGGTRRRLGLCFVDLDGFKAVNDGLGHDVGDQLLVAVADRLRVTLVDGQLLIRIGGDEFVILLADTAGIEDVTEVARRVLAALAEPIQVGAHLLTAGASLGLAESPVGTADFGDLMRDADRSLYRAKEAGRGRWAVVDSDHDDHQVSRHTLAPMLASAVRRDEFVVHYQPIVALTPAASTPAIPTPGSGSASVVVGVEALVHWRHPRFGLLAPEMFLGPAERTGQIGALGRRVLELACGQAASWPATQDAPHYVSVNLSAGQLREPGLVDQVDRILDAAGLPANRLQLELTEAVVLGPAGGPTRVLRDLAALGVRLAVDDFGSGYANLTRLHRLPLHSLKLSSSLVSRDEDGATDPGGESTVRALVGLGHAFGLTVIAEGVETDAQAERLRRVQCDGAQGHLFARPLPPEELHAWLAVSTSGTETEPPGWTPSGAVPSGGTVAGAGSVSAPSAAARGIPRSQVAGPHVRRAVG
ncbi:bifunctional diguanylate cyclase/phosphodiesterase [Frankia sp. AiPa1]|uniref:putative bifunctional diguanylate cyclase/phosphodiesterase n=1 Tax=Frankia sp. AiPa1 TaxID=573492 RepID=UPI00202B5346|nr:EAL domain-containing protein [Frankia sp. AiPa1]MCL9759174.1 EAL domain-containing protein [Frankia sp. AiPa1]